MLATQNLSIEELWFYEGALQWWQNTFTTTILPTTQILTTTGIATILTSQLLKFAQKDPKKKNPTNNPLKKTQNYPKTKTRNYTHNFYLQGILI